MPPQANPCRRIFLSMAQRRLRRYSQDSPRYDVSRVTLRHPNRLEDNVRKLAGFALTFTLCFAVALPAQTRHTPTLDESLSLKVINGARISPDGRFVAYRVRETNWEDNSYIRQLWIANVATGESFELTRGKKSIEDFEWAPDSRWLAFVTEREQSAIVPPEPDKKDADKKAADKKDEKTETKGDKKAAMPGEDKPGDDKPGKPAAHQIWLISPAGGEAWQLTRQETDVQSIHWSKDGKQIAFTASTKESKADKDRKEKYSDYEVFEEDFKQSQLWTVDVAPAQSNFLPAKARQISRTTRSSISTASPGRPTQRSSRSTRPQIRSSHFAAIKTSTSPISPTTTPSAKSSRSTVPTAIPSSRPTASKSPSPPRSAPNIFITPTVTSPPSISIK